MAPRTRPVVDISATCSCGSVSIAVSGPVLAMLQCACLDCQKITGGGHASVALALETSVTITGETRAYSRPADSGATLTRQFCPVCGTGIVAQSSRASGVRMLPVGLFGADTAWFEPNQMIFARSHRAWDLIADDLERHTTYREGPL